jgi:hypothetical protein
LEQFMSLYNPEGTPPIIPTGMARVERSLPYPGEVLVRTGGRVEPEDIVARAYVPAPPHILNVAQMLAAPASRIARLVNYEVGSRIEEGEELARSGWRTCSAPVTGQVSAVDTTTGYVTITPEPETFDLHAALRGIAMEIQPYRGVTIETPATQIYGVFGLGIERSGVLRLLVTDATEIITAEYVNVRSAYSVIIGGAGITAEALRRAVAEQVRGVVVGSIDERELRDFLQTSGRALWHTGSGGWQFPQPRQAGDPGLTLLITEGFGAQPMSQAIFDVLSARDRQEVLIEGSTTLRQTQQRPRLIVPTARGSGTMERPRPQIAPGAQVRLLNSTYLGQVATVRAVSSVALRLESGVRTPAVEVAVEGAEPVWVPRTAVEVLA